MNQDLLLSVKNLAVDFRTDDGLVRAVKNISFDIPRGKTVGLVGESGSGKSVTSLALMRLIPNPPGTISEGKILFDGHDLLSLSENKMREIRGNRISMIFQEPMTSLNPVFTVGDQIVEALRLHQGLSKKDAYDRAVELLDQVGIPKPASRVKDYPHLLSGGQRQRVMIAMAIACEPDLLIADEPTTALDVTIQKQILDLLGDLQAKSGMSMLFITHDLGVIADIADEAIVMYRGDIVESGKTADLFTMPKHPYTKGLLACRPSLNLERKRLPVLSDFMTDAGEEKAAPQFELRESAPSTETRNVNAESKLLKPESVPLLEIRDIQNHFPIRGGLLSRVQSHVRAVDGVSFKVQKGKTLGLVGESGCGKTTLGRTILRLIEPTAGEILFDGRNLVPLSKEELKKTRKRMQIIFQDPYASLNPRMSVHDIITEPLVIHKLAETRSERTDMAADLLHKVGLSPAMLSRYPHEFSGGQRQRISIARALAVKPEFIICDESVSALDVSIQAQILNLLLDLQDEMGLTYLFISHDLGVVKFISDDVAVMNAGKIVEMSSAEAIYESPQHAYTQKLLSAIPKGIPKAMTKI